jgi:hypothetical protein
MMKDFFCNVLIPCRYIFGIFYEILLSCLHHIRPDAIYHAGWISDSFQLDFISPVLIAGLFLWSGCLFIR